MRYFKVRLNDLVSWLKSSLFSPPEFGVKLGSQIFIKHITDSGLAARSRGLQEGDLILQVRSGLCFRWGN